MKPFLLKVPTDPVHSFSARHYLLPNVNNRWHCHAEAELLYFHKGSGTQFVGDSIKRFGPGDLALVGANLPHYWRYDAEYTDAKEDGLPYSTVIHFQEDFWGQKFLHLPESTQIKSLFDKARLGLFIPSADAAPIRKLVEAVYNTEGLERLVALLQCFLAISQCDKVHTLSSMGFRNDLSESENDRINAIYEYTMGRFKEEVYLGEVASIAGLVPNSFCRYFKARTGKTYSQFLTEIRIGYACKLLIENKMSLKQVCYESGFNNFSCFHKNFKAITGNTPQKYQEQHHA